MRLWHKYLIPYLPKQQLLGQWRECCCIARNIKMNGTPNHILVNKIMDYPPSHFINYSAEVARIMVNRDYNIDFSKFTKHIDDIILVKCQQLDKSEIFSDWHNERYLKQCFYNLQEKYDCGGITKSEYDKLKEATEMYKEWYKILRR